MLRWQGWMAAFMERCGAFYSLFLVILQQLISGCHDSASRFRHEMDQQILTLGVCANVVSVLAHVCVDRS